VLDLGCGPADIPLRLARQYPGAVFDALDGSRAMLDEAQRLWASAGLSERVRLLHADLDRADLPAGHYDAVVSNSLLHHLHRPERLWRRIRHWAQPGAMVLVMDLARPDGPQALAALVERYAADAPAVLRRDFGASLAAAFRPEEVRAQLAAAGLGQLRVDMVSDRHLAASGWL
jgi:cyclopropane fatty-acyl-phospholipid synthase-like methyltransferase